MEVGKKYFEELIDKMKDERGVKLDVELTADDLKELATQFKAEYKKQLGEDFPSDPVEQLKLAIEAGRLAYLSKPGRVLPFVGEASSPLTGFLTD